MKRCHRCGAEWTGEKRQPGVKEYCEQCSAYLHCCMNCRFHRPHAHNECQVPNSEWVGDRKGGNFCGDFEFLDMTLEGGEDEKNDKARDALAGLFGDDSGEEKKPAAFDDLFTG